MQAGLERAAWALAWLPVFSLPLEKSVIVFEIGSVSRTLGLAAFAVTLALAVGNRGAPAQNRVPGGRAKRAKALRLIATAFFIATNASNWNSRPTMRAIYMSSSKAPAENGSLSFPRRHGR